MGQFVVWFGAGDAISPDGPKICAVVGVLGELCPRNLGMLVVGEVVVVVEKKQADGLGDDKIPCAVVGI